MLANTFSKMIECARGVKSGHTVYDGAHKEERAMRVRHGVVRASLAMFMLLAGLLVGVPTGRAAEQACFQETGQCIDEPFLTYWQEHGGRRSTASR